MSMRPHLPGDRELDSGHVPSSAIGAALARGGMSPRADTRNRRIVAEMDLEGLRSLARARQVKGRSKMNAEELRRALTS